MEASKKEKKTTSPTTDFFAPEYAFINNFLLWEKHNTNGSLNDFIAQQIITYGQSEEGLKSLLKLIPKNPIIKKYCFLEHSGLHDFWREKLLLTQSNFVADDKNESSLEKLLQIHQRQETSIQPPPSPS